MYAHIEEEQYTSSIRVDASKDQTIDGKGHPASTIDPQFHSSVAARLKQGQSHTRRAHDVYRDSEVSTLLAPA